MITYTIECGGFTGSQLQTVKAVQAWLDDKKAQFNLKGEQVRVYKFINGIRHGQPELLGAVS